MSLKIAFVGTARRAQGHLQSLSKMEDVEIAALCDLAEEKAQQASEQFGGRVYTDYRAMLEKEALNVLYIITPPLAHADPAVMAAERGIHLFLEKPLALSVAEGERIREAVEQSGVMASVGYQLRYWDIVDRAVEMLSERPVAMATGHYYWTVPPIAWVMDKRNTGGQIVEQATHLVDLCRYIVGEITTVYARYTLRTRIGVPGFNNWDANCVTMAFANGAVGSMVATYSLFPGIPDNSALDLIADELLLRISGGKLRTFTRETQETFPAEADPTFRANEAFVQAIRTGDRSLIRSSVQDGLRSLAVTLAANRSAETGTPVEVDSMLEI